MMTLMMTIMMSVMMENWYYYYTNDAMIAADGDQHLYAAYY
jgi:hypothetical protein